MAHLEVVAPHPGSHTRARHRASSPTSVMQLESQPAYRNSEMVAWMHAIISSICGLSVTFDREVDAICTPSGVLSGDVRRVGLNLAGTQKLFRCRP